ncbi:putative non-specific serine/threonine protein kinase [Helianthus annuus]|nr:putative non-specific serine/threonine protein kinase [Helianthus annuus]
MVFLIYLYFCFPLRFSDKNSMTVVIIVVTATVSVVILALVFFCVFTRRKRRLESRSSGMNSVREKGDTEEITTAKSLQYSFGVIKAATNNFSENNKLGDGGFGVVYKVQNHTISLSGYYYSNID